MIFFLILLLCCEMDSAVLCSARYMGAYTGSGAARPSFSEQSDETRILETLEELPPKKVAPNGAKDPILILYLKTGYSYGAKLNLNFEDTEF